jgi:hypothetical protein
MPRYFFDTQGSRRVEDDEGVDLQDADTARLEAVKFAGACIYDRPYLLSESRDMRVEVHDENGVFVSMVTVFVTNDPTRRNSRAR